jgi:hypothetical protein
MACVVGWQPIWKEKHRWGICAQDMCFKNAFVSSFCGAGQVLPVNRGAGVDQPLMAGIARKVSSAVASKLVIFLCEEASNINTFLQSNDI